MKQYKPPYPRVRMRGIPPTPERFTQTLSGAPEGNGVVAYADAMGTGSYCVMSDTVTPGFKAKRANGAVIFNPMHMVEFVTSASGGSLVVKQVSPVEWSNAKYTCDGDWFRAHLVITPGLRTNSDRNAEMLVPVISTDYGSRLERAIAVSGTKAQTIPSDASLLVAMAEYKKTLKLLPDVLHGWRQLFTRINAREAAFSKKRTASRNQDAARNLRDLQDTLLNTWLAMRFGARPLVHDTVGVLKALRRNRSDSVVRATQRGFATFSDSSTSSGTLAVGLASCTVTEQSEAKSSVRAMSLWESQIDTLDDLGVNLAHVPEAIVDLTRFSFVLNWVVNINDFALALGSAIQTGWSQRGGCYVVENESSTLYTPASATVSANPNYAIETGWSGHVLCTKREKFRVPSLPSPSLVLRPSPLDWGKDFRLLDAIALLRQQTRGKGVLLLAQSLGRTPGVP